MNSPFEGARTSAYALGWSTLIDQSPDEEMDTNNGLIELRRRAKELIKNNPAVAGAQQAYVNLIMNSGPTVYVKSSSRLQAKDANDLLRDWQFGCDISGTCSFAHILEQIVDWSFGDGDIAINLPLDKNREGVQTVVELVEANRIKTPSDKTKTKIQTNPIRHGVQYDTEGRIQGYWVRKSSVSYVSGSENSVNFDFFPVNNAGRKVTQLFKAPLNERPNMSRQYPVITPCMTLFKYIKDYLEAVLVGARVAACFSAFITTNSPASTYSGMTTDINGNTVDNYDGTKKVQKLQPGQVFYLKPNEKVDFAAPNTPSDNHDALMVRLYKVVSMYLRVPYAILFLDLEKVNYSSWRGGGLETRKMIQRWRRELEVTLRWIINTVLYEGFARGLIRGDFSGLEIRVRWPAYGILDPEKEARANKLRLQNGTVTPQMIAEEEGIDYVELREEQQRQAIEDVEREALVLKRKKELELEHGIVFQSTTDAEKGSRDTSDSRRPGENTDPDLDEDDAAERRKEDGNI